MAMLVQSIWCRNSPSLSSAGSFAITPLSLFCPRCLKHFETYNFHASFTHSNRTKNAKDFKFTAPNDENTSISNYLIAQTTGEELSGESYNNLISGFCRA
ncbi:hypothetical protein ACFX19_002326 [Malus domestica]